jgi:Sec-independent protein translocase protein TatA
MGQANSIENLLTWKDLIMMTMGFSFLVAPLGGILPLAGTVAAAIFFGFSNISKLVRDSENEKGKPDNTQRKAAFIGCLVVGVVVSYILGAVTVAGIMDQKKFDKTAVMAGVGLGAIMTAICLAFFINYGMVLGWWTPTGGLVTLLFSIIPAVLIGKNIGITIIVSFITSSSVYAWLVADNKNRKEPWMIWQSTYIGLMMGSAVGLLLPTSDEYNQELGKQKSQPPGVLKVSLDVPGGISKEDQTTLMYRGIDGMSAVLWAVYLIIWVLTFVPGALPYGWNALFNVGKTAELREKQAKEAKKQKEKEKREAKKQKEKEKLEAKRQKEEEKRKVKEVKTKISSIQSAFKRF